MTRASHFKVNYSVRCQSGKRCALQIGGVVVASCSDLPLSNRDIDDLRHLRDKANVMEGNGFLMSRFKIHTLHTLLVAVHRAGRCFPVREIQGNPNSAHRPFRPGPSGRTNLSDAAPPPRRAGGPVLRELPRGPLRAPGRPRNGGAAPRRAPVPGEQPPGERPTGERDLCFR